jgi:hypothetical protein
MDDWTALPPSARLDDAPQCGDVAPFDRVEAIARQLCRAAGRDWDAKHCKHGHWRRRASAVLAAEQPRPAGWWPRLVALGRRVLS